MTPDELAALTHRPGPGPHRTTITVDGRTVETLADLPPLRDRLLFIGLNPSPVSVEAGHYHQGKLGRTFWKRLGAAGILPPGTPAEAADDALVAAGHGITDLLKVPTPRDEATDAELTAGVGALWQKIALWRPAAVVFIYKRAASIAAGHALEEPWGVLIRGGARRPPVLPHARPVRPGRVGRRGDQLPAEPGGLAADRPGVSQPASPIASSSAGSSSSSSPAASSWSSSPAGSSSSTPGSPRANAARRNRYPAAVTYPRASENRK